MEQLAQKLDTAGTLEQLAQKDDVKTSGAMEQLTSTEEHAVVKGKKDVALIVPDSEDDEEHAEKKHASDEGKKVRDAKKPCLPDSFYKLPLWQQDEAMVFYKICMPKFF